MTNTTTQKCNYCDRHFKNEHALGVHMFRKHKLRKADLLIRKDVLANGTTNEPIHQQIDVSAQRQNVGRGEKTAVIKEYLTAHPDKNIAEITQLIEQQRGLTVSVYTVKGIKQLHNRRAITKPRRTIAKPTSNGQIAFCPCCGLNLAILQAALTAAKEIKDG